MVPAEASFRQRASLATASFHSLPVIASALLALSYVSMSWNHWKCIVERCFPWRLLRFGGFMSLELPCAPLPPWSLAATVLGSRWETSTESPHRWQKLCLIVLHEVILLLSATHYWCTTCGSTCRSRMLLSPLLSGPPICPVEISWPSSHRCHRQCHVGLYQSNNLCARRMSNRRVSGGDES